MPQPEPTATDCPTLTHIAFVRYATRIAQLSAAWAADTCDMIEYPSDPIPSATVKRYLNDMRARLDHMETTGLVKR